MNALPLISGYFDGELDPADRDAFARLLRDDPAFAMLLAECSVLECQLRDMSLSDEVRRPAHRPRQAMRRRLILGLAAAIVLSLGLVMGLLIHTAAQQRRDRLRAATGPILATLIDTQNARWQPTGMPTAPGSQLPGGWLQLESGTAQIVFLSGAQVTLTGPCEFGINSPLRGELRSGTLTAAVPHTARGFTIGAPGCAVVDLGTEFGLHIDPAGRTRVHVFKGAVKIEPLDGAAPVRLTLGDTRDVSPAGRVTLAPFEPADFNVSPTPHVADALDDSAVIPNLDRRIVMTPAGLARQNVSVVGHVTLDLHDPALHGLPVARFDGGDSFLVVPDVAGSVHLWRSYTVAAWVRPDSADTQNVIARMDGAPEQFFSDQVRILDGHFTHHSRDAKRQECVGHTAVVPGRWYHVVITAESFRGVWLYVNGKLDGAYTGKFGRLVDNASRFRIGGKGGIEPAFRGELADVRLYRHAMDAEEVNDLYRSELRAANPDSVTSNVGGDAGVSDHH